MINPVIVVHYHELWLKGGNRRFFLGKLHLFSGGLKKLFCVLQIPLQFDINLFELRGRSAAPH